MSNGLKNFKVAYPNGQFNNGETLVTGEYWDIHNGILRFWIAGEEKTCFKEWISVKDQMRR